MSIVTARAQPAAPAKITLQFGFSVFPARCMADPVRPVPETDGRRQLSTVRSQQRRANWWIHLGNRPGSYPHRSIVTTRPNFPIVRKFSTSCNARGQARQRNSRQTLWPVVDRSPFLDWERPGRTLGHAVSTRASEIDHRRLQSCLLLCTNHFTYHTNTPCSAETPAGDLLRVLSLTTEIRESVCSQTSLGCAYAALLNAALNFASASLERDVFSTRGL
jgi:hypothetical protein